MKKIFTFVIGALICATTASAAVTVDITGCTEGYSYTLQDGDILTGTCNYAIKIMIAKDASVTLDNVKLNKGGTIMGGDYAGLSPLGTCHIYLKGTNIITSIGVNEPGIFLPKQSTVHIYEKTSGASLEVRGNGYGAGIGGAMNNTEVGHLRIHGGIIKAYGGDYAAGIGSAQNSKCGNIIIDGGTITAEGSVATADVHESAAAIGSGKNGTCGSITINGGTINAKGTGWAAGIGTGENGTCGAISITGGSVTAKGGTVAPGIGSGGGGTCGTVTIASAVSYVKATKGDTSPNSIGKGADGTVGTVKVADKTISGGVTESPFIYPIPAPTGLKVTDPSASTAVVSWTAASGVLKYEVRYMKAVDGEGYYTATTTKTSLILSDLKPNTAYDVWVVAYGSGNLFSAETAAVRFSTKSPEGIESIQQSAVSGQKVIRNGQLLIIKNGKTYNALGAEIK